jgi:hypothetical protein
VKMFQLLALLRNWRNNYQAKKFKGNRAGRQRVGPTCGFAAFSEVGLGPLSVPYRLGTPTYKFQVKTRSSACTHMLPRVL